MLGCPTTSGKCLACVGLQWNSFVLASPRVMRLSLRKLAQLTLSVLCFIYLNFVYWTIHELFEEDRRTPASLALGQKGNGVDVPKDAVRDKRSAGYLDSRTKLGLLFDRLNRTHIDIATVRHKTNLKTVKDKLTPVLKNDNDAHLSVSVNPAWESSRMTELSDIFISVKTTRNNHNTRVRLLLDTWASVARAQTYFFTDQNDEELEKHVMKGHVINTNCTNTHSRQSLCCKMAMEFDFFMESQKRWFCHVDDDNYINSIKLVELLRTYNHTGDWYVGKPSLKHPIEVLDRKNPPQKMAFWFATGGAGFCISRGLALKMMPYASGGRLMTVGESIRLPDDCTVGYIIDHILHKSLTVMENFHSHLESLCQIKDLKNQVTLSYAISNDKKNVVDITGFSVEEDPTRLRSLHCHIHGSENCLSLNAD